MTTNNKKAEISGEVILVIPKILFLTAVLFAVVILVKVFIVAAIDVRQVESNVLISRLLYSRDALSYFDQDINRVYSGVIDLNKFKELSANNPNFLDNKVISYGADNPIISAKIILKQEGKSDIIAYYNKDRYDKWVPRVLPTVRGGAGSVKSFKDTKYILVKEEEKLSPAIMEFDIIGWNEKAQD